jgi:hypothetical protein
MTSRDAYIAPKSRTEMEELLVDACISPSTAAAVLLLIKATKRDWNLSLQWTPRTSFPCRTQYYSHVEYRCGVTAAHTVPVLTVPGTYLLVI